MVERSGFPITETPQLDLGQARQVMNRLSAELTESVFFHDDLDKTLLVGAACLSSSVMFEGKPGVGKTVIAKTMAGAMGGTYGRIQGTADLLPSDILGVEIFHPSKHDFDFREGPIFNNVVLVDEANRIPPKSQSGLLEAMAEGQVTVGGVTYPLPRPFLVMATQNHYDIRQGTSPLSDTNIDRIAISMEFPELEEQNMVDIRALRQGETSLLRGPGRTPVNTGDILAVEEVIGRLPIDVNVQHRAARIVVALRSLKEVSTDTTLLGGQRPFNEMLRFGQALALSRGQAEVKDKDITDVAPYVLRHRTVLSHTALDEGTPIGPVIGRAIRLADVA